MQHENMNLNYAA